MPTRLGKDAKFYYSATLLSGVPVWVLINPIEDVQLSEERDTDEIKNRASDDATVLVGHVTRSIEVTLTHKPADAGFEALRDAFHNKTVIAVAAMDGVIATVGSEGLQMDAVVTSFRRGEQTSQHMTYQCTLRPSAESTAAPQWVEVSA